MIKINLLKEKYKVCSRCGEVKSVNCFHKRGKSGYQPKCKNCRSRANPIYHMENKKYCPQCKEMKEKDSSNWQKSCKTKDGWQGICKKCRNENKNEYREKNREEINRKNREYYNRQEIKEKREKYTKQYYRDNIEWYGEWHKEYRSREETKEYKREWFKSKYNSDIRFKLHSCFSSQLWNCLNSKGIVKDRKCFEIVGYNLEELKYHLERQFDNKMNWNNYGSYWHIDHIKPKVSFSFNSYEDEEFKKCWSLDNLRPLEKIENLQKGDRIIDMKKGE